MELFRDVAGEMINQCATDVVDHVGTIGGVLQGYAGGRRINTSDGVAKLQADAARSLFGMIGLDVKVLDAFKEHPDLQQQMSLAKLDDSKVGDKEIMLRGSIVNGKPVYHAVVSDQYVPVNNATLLQCLLDVLPETTQVHAARINKRTMMLRLVERGWIHDLGPGGTAYTGLVVRNDEIARTTLSIRAGVARVACWNYTMHEEPIFEHKHNIIWDDEVTSGIRDGIERLDEISGSVHSALMESQDIHVEDVAAMIRGISTELKLPAYAEEAARNWWEEQGSPTTFFWVAQAVSYAAASMTSGKRRRWADREEVEYQIVNMTRHFNEHGELRVCECPRCHRPFEHVEADVVEGEYEIG